MKTYYIETEVRWGDLDANRHLANFAHQNLYNYARIAYLRKLGITMDKLNEWKIGPAVLQETLSYFREGKEGDQLVISSAINGVSNDSKIFSFEQNIYRKDGLNLSRLNLIGVWFSMADRKMTIPPQEMIDALNNAIDPEDSRILTMDDIKSLPHKPANIDFSVVESL